ncbi:hypothetical protein BT96DRAFT_1002985 [Gymnopus androsaceus JB14]|uniref:Uncharacterized protein n=1 Tax=Gymnopus androsaceus JB14 TaxID=1447944 RepID=A0A6A4GV80_9AGAR|nr:hypothetical protein BT96DRAFT_1002985 [Gymnopus androsaceus JB14]
MGQDTKIDLEKNLIQISRLPQPVYQSVIEKTRGLAMKTQALGAVIARTGAVRPVAPVPSTPVPQSAQPVAEVQEVPEAALMQAPGEQHPIPICKNGLNL